MPETYEGDALPPMHDPNDGPLITPDGTNQHPYGLNRHGHVVRNPYYKPPAAKAAPAARSNQIAEREMANAGLPSITTPPERPKQPDPATAPIPASPDEANRVFAKFLFNPSSTRK